MAAQAAALALRNRRLRRLAGAVVGIAVTSPLLIVAIFGGAAANYAATGCSTPGHLRPILQTIREMESGDNYLEASRAKTSGADRASGWPSGAYQFVYTTWNGYGGYDEAHLAPPEIQDARAASDVQRFLDAHGGDIAAVPVGWYIPAALDNPDLMDTVPNAAYNTLTPREYMIRWLDHYRQVLDGASVEEVISTAQCAAANYAGPGIPPGTTQLRCGQLSWGGYRNGEIPANAMRATVRSGSMYPPASEAFDQLWTAAQQAGLDISGWSYRPASEQTHPQLRGKSCHGLGLAVDITLLQPGKGYCNTLDACFASPMWQWLNTNGPTYGFAWPDWAIEGGGCVQGGGCGQRESWHLEWMAFLSQPNP